MVLIWNILTVIVSGAKYVIFTRGEFSSVSYNSLVFLTMNSGRLENRLGDAICATASNFFVSHSQGRSGEAWYQWLGENILVVNISCIMTVYAVFVIIFITSRFYYKSATISLWDYFIRLSMLSYYSLTYVSLYHLAHSIFDIGLSMVAIIVLFFNTLCFPLYIYVTVNGNRSKFRDRRFQYEYGSMYLEYKPECATFSSLLLFKQLVYAVLSVFLVHSRFEISIALGCQCLVNFMYAGTLWYLKPFKRNVHLIQAYVVVGIKFSIILVLAINLVPASMPLNITAFALNTCIYIANFLAYITVSLQIRTNKEQDRTEALMEIHQRLDLPFWVVKEYMRDKEIQLC